MRTCGAFLLPAFCQSVVAADAARELGYDLATDLTRHLDADEKGMHTVHTLGGKPGGIQATRFLRSVRKLRGLFSRR